MTLLQIVSGACAGRQLICFHATLLWVFGAPIAFIAFSLMLLWTIGWRVKWLGLSAVWTVAVAIWLLAAGPGFFIGVFSLFGGLLTKRLDLLPTSLLVQPLPLVLFLLTLIAFLWRAEPEHARPDEAMRRWAITLAAAAAAHVAILHVGPALSTLHLIVSLRPLTQRPLIDMLEAVTTVASFGIPPAHRRFIHWADLAVFCVALAYVLKRTSGHEAPPGSVAIKQAIRKADPPPPSAAPRASFGKRGT